MWNIVLTLISPHQCETKEEPPDDWVKQEEDNDEEEEVQMMVEERSWLQQNSDMKVRCGSLTRLSLYPKSMPK